MERVLLFLKFFFIVVGFAGQHMLPLLDMGIVVTARQATRIMRISEVFDFDEADIKRLRRGTQVVRKF